MRRRSERSSVINVRPGPTVAAALLMLLLPAAAAGQEGPQRAGALLELDQIQAAIRRGVDYLRNAPPSPTFEESWKYTHIDYRWDHELHYATGNHCVAIWAMLACGESYQHPDMYRRLNIVMSLDSAYIYDRGMRAQMLAELPRARWAPWVHREGAFLTSALTDQGNFGRQYTGGAAAGIGDNAHGQYGVLGLAGLERAGWDGIRRKHWAMVDAYWRAAQQPGTDADAPAGWAIYSLFPGHAEHVPKGLPSYTNVRGPMTAGGVAVLSVTERALRGPRMDIGRESLSPQIRKGLAWLDRNFTLSDAAEELDRYFYFFTIQSVGRYTGYRTFNGIDWFREVTAALLAEQAADGSWSGPKGRMLSTSFALLYLARARAPLSISKIRWKNVDRDGNATVANWNNRPHDIWNFVDYASDQYEVATTWQIVELDQPLYELIESRMLYLSTNERFDLSDEQVARLRAYVDAGGLLVTNPDASDGGAVRSMRALAERMFAADGYELVKVPDDHALRQIHATDVKTPMEMVHNGVRPLMLHFTRDIGRDLQRFDTASPSFQALSNAYLFLTGKKPNQARLANNHVHRRNRRPSRPLAAARIRHRGHFDPEPAALTQLRAILANDHDIDLRVDTVAPTRLGDRAIAFLTTVGAIDMATEEIDALREWVGGGGTLWIDVAGGGEDGVHSVRSLVERIGAGARPKLLGRRDPIVSGRGLENGHDCARVRYRLYSLRVMGRKSQPELEMIERDGRAAVVYSTMDLTCGLAGLDHWGIFGYTPESARRLVVNGCLAVIEAETQPDPDTGDGAG